MAMLLLKGLKGNTKFISVAHGGDINADNKVEKTLVNRALKMSDLIIPVSHFSGSKIVDKIDKNKMTPKEKADEAIQLLIGLILMSLLLTIKTFIM